MLHVAKRLKDLGLIDEDEEGIPTKRREDDGDDDDVIVSKEKKNKTTDLIAPEFEESQYLNGQLEFLTLARVASDAELQAKLWPRLQAGHFASDTALSIFNRLKTLHSLGREWPKLTTLALDPALPKATQAALATFISSAEAGRLSSEVDIGNGVRVPISSASDFETYVYDILDGYRQIRQAAEKVVAVTTKIADEDVVDPLTASAWYYQMASEIMALKGQEAITDSIVHYGYATSSEDEVKRIGEVNKIFSKDRHRSKIGFKTYDDKVGGYQPGEVVLLGANSGGGKTAMALSQMVNMARMGTSVAMLQLELTNSQVNERLSANLANIDADLIRNGKVSDKQRLQIVNAHKEFSDELKMARSRFTIFAPSAATIQDCEFVFKSFSYKVWFIDYINLLKWEGGGSKADSRTGEDWSRLSDIVKEFKRIAKRLGITIVLMVQVNIDKDNGEITIRYARAMQEHADVVMVWNLNKEAKEEGMVWLRHLKARQYEAFDFPVRVALHHGRFESVDMAVLPKTEERKLGNKKKVREEADSDQMFKKKNKKDPEKVDTTPEEPTVIPQDFRDDDLMPAVKTKLVFVPMENDKYKEFEDEE